jgi:uncharacterized protein DUF6176
MIRVAFARVKPHKIERLESWLRELMSRQDEVRETFVQETVRHEQAFILHEEKGPLLIYVMEAEDHERGREAFRLSQLPIDLEHRRVMNEVLAEKLQVAPLYDCAI